MFVKGGFHENLCISLYCLDLSRDIIKELQISSQRKMINSLMYVRVSFILIDSFTT